MLKFILILGLFVLAVTGVTCPSGYSTKDSITCYRVYTTPSTKSDAATQCQNDGGYLASIPNGFNNSYINQLGTSASATSMWLGIQCSNGTKGSCLNDDYSTFGPYDNFYSGNPSVLGACVYMSNSNPASGFWISFDCSNKLPFICEYSDALKCSSGYSKFNNACYRLFSSAGEFDAEKQCQSACGHLVSIHSVEENSFVTSLAASASGSSNMVRIGLQSSGSAHLWMDNTTYNYNNIGYDNPNIGKCYGLSVVDEVVRKSQWSSQNCDYVTPYVCKAAVGTCQTPGNPTRAPPTCDSPKTFNGAGTIYAPGYPANVANLTNCVYFITTLPGTVVEIDSSSSIDKTSVFKSTENQMMIVYSVSSYSSGWKLSYRPASGSLQCPSGYSLNTGNSVCYALIVLKLTKQQASDYCKSHVQFVAQGSLASIPNSQVNSFLLSLKTPFPTDHIITGLTCPNVRSNGDASSCVWDDGSSLSYTNFPSSQPKAGSNTCVYFMNDGTWNNDGCGYANYFFCEAALTVV